MDIRERYKQVSDRVRKGVAMRGALQNVVKAGRETAQKAQERHENALLAKELVLSVAEKTQLNIGKRISDLVSLALASVFEIHYEFQIEFVQRRGVTEADLWLVTEGGQNKMEPLSTSGGGVVDIISFALRLSLWTLRKSAPIFILDEPFKFLSADRHTQAGLLLKNLSRKLGLQFIIVSHQTGINNEADRLFMVKDGHVTVGI